MQSNLTTQSVEITRNVEVKCEKLNIYQIYNLLISFCVNIIIIIIMTL
jgi:hypothetical protein